ncbi:MAG: hypothetical protein HFG66_07360 [Hungatella sp.]|nr:hypothetical protein [Hungatella sp.]
MPHMKIRAADILLFLLLTEIFYFYNTYVNIGGFGVGYQYIGCILVVVVGVWLFLAVPDLHSLYSLTKTGIILALPYVTAMLCSWAVWIFDFVPVRQMISGFFEPAYMILCIVCAVFLVYMLQDKAVEYSFWAMTAAFILLLIPKVRLFGAAGFLRRLMEYVKSMGRVGWGVSLEDTSFSYTYVFYGLYFLFRDFHRKGEPFRRRLVRVTIIIFALLEVFKRSSLLALAAGGAVAAAYTFMPHNYRKYFLNFIVAAFVLSAFFYIPIVRYGIFRKIVEILHINTSSRTRIYAYYSRYYTFSPFYGGKGLGWIARLMAMDERFNVGLESVNVHCDYIRSYIELGFWGYLCWMLLVFPLAVKRTVKGKNLKNDAIILGVCTAMALLRVTENISQLYSAILGMSIIIIQCSREKTV